MGGGGAGRSVGDQIDTREQADAAHLSDGFMSRLKRPEPVQQPRPHAGRVLLQAFIIDDLQDFASDPAGQGRAAEG